MLSLFFLSSLAARRIIFIPLLTGMLIYHYIRKRINLNKVFAVGIIFFLLFILMGYFRYHGTFQIKEKFLLSRLYHEINLYSNLLYKTTEVFPEQKNFLGWKGFIQPFKAILPGTQKSIGNILKEDIMEMEFRGGGFMPSILGGFYINFGLWGVLIGMFLCGLVSKALYLNMLRRKDEFSTILFSYVSVYFISAIQGMVLGEIWPIYVVFIFFVTNKYCRKEYNKLSKNNL
jgi:oligosaccharide repeat unit polymerase